MTFHLLDHPIYLSAPQRVTSSGWTQHVPFGMLLLDLLRPRVLVELGACQGLSYCAFCQAVAELGLDTRCFAVDTWAGDEHAGFYGDEALADLKAHHDAHYARFSSLIQSTFDAARAQFADQSIDLLHLDGLHTYAAVRHDFDSWLPKLSDRGVVVLHDIAERAGTFGVWRLWDELKQTYPHHLEFEHGHGLGIVAVGPSIPEGLRSLMELPPLAWQAMRETMRQLGGRLEASAELEQVRQQLRQLQQSQQAGEERAEREREFEQAMARAEETHRVAEAARAALARSYQERLVDAEQRLAEVQRRLDHAQGQLAWLESSRGVRVIKLARAARAVVQRKGPLSLAKYMALWLMGKRGYYQREIESQTNAHYPSVAQYEAWRMSQRTPTNELEAQRGASEALALRPLISFVVPVFNPDPHILEETIASVLAQTYDRWELCLVDGCSTAADVRDVLERYAAQDARIRVTFLETNRGIAGNSNEAITRASGEYVTLLDHDDLIEPDLLYRVVEAINQTPQTDVVYYDENLVSSDGAQYSPIGLKPGWSPELLLSTPFMTHCVIRRQFVVDAGGFDPALDGTQDWDLFLRLSERTNNVVRIPRVLYHWRKARGSAAADVNAKPYVFERQLAAIQNHMTRVTGQDATAWWVAPGVPRVTWTPRPTHVSIIIPTKDTVENVRRCVSSIVERTTYRDFDIVLVDTGSTERATLEYYATLAPDERISVVGYEGDFNYARACNVGATHARGASLLFMHDDLEVVDADWLEELVRWSNIPEIGVVGAKLLYPNRTIQHAGLIIGSAGLAGHIYHQAKEDASSLLGSVNWYRNLLAVTGALHMMRREVYDAIGGYDESYDMSYSDVALCYQAAQRGYRVLYDPFVQLMHYESQTREGAPSLHDARLAATELLPVIEAGDPYFNPHLSYQQSTPQLKLRGEPTPIRMLEQITGISARTLQAQRIQEAEKEAAGADAALFSTQEVGAASE